MKSFKTLLNHSHKAHFPWEIVNPQNLLTKFLENGGLIGESQFRLTPNTDKALQITTSVFVDSSYISKHGQVSTFNSEFLDIFKQKNTDNIIPFFLTELLDKNIDNRHFFIANKGLKKSVFFDNYRSELEQYQPIHAGLSSNVDNHVESNADTVISRTIIEVSKNPETELDETKLKDNLTVVFAETLQNNSELGFLEIYGIVDTALRDSYDYLSKFRFDPEYSQKLETAFGNGFNREVADKLFNNFADRHFTDIPTIKIVNRADIYGGNAAFSADTGLVYLAVEFLTENHKNPSIITDVLLEEIGHFVDSQINKIDSPGDEGEIFANLVQGNLLREQELQALKSENDIATIISSNQGITVISGQSAINVEQNVKPLRVATWNIWNEGGAQANNTIEGIKRRINYIARFGMATGIDVIALQEIKNPGTDPLANALQAYKTNNTLPGTYTREGLQAILSGYDFIVATSENNPNNPQNTPNSTDGYLILFNPNTITMGNASFFSPGTFSGIANNSTYYIRPPYEVNIQYKQTNKAYKILTWHNEYEGGQLGAQARFTGMQRLKEGLQSLQANSPTIVLGDFNVRPNEIQQKSEINLFAQGYTGAYSAEYDYILANPQGARVAQFGLTIENFPQLTSDAHTALFAEIDGREPVRRTVENTQIEVIQNLTATIAETNRSVYEYNTTSISDTWIDQTIKIGKAGSFFTPQTTVGGGKVTVREETVNGQTKKYIDVKPNSSGVNAKVYSAIGKNQTSALFNGEVSFDTSTLKGTITDKGDSNDSSAFKLIGGIEVNFDGLSFGEDKNGSPQLRLQGSMLLPKNLVGGNGLLVAINGTDYIGISDNGLEVTGGFVKLPGTTSFVVLGLLEIKALDAQVKFDFTNEEITLQGKFSIPTLKNATFDLQGGNYIKVKKTATGLDFSMVANVGVANIPLFGSWEIQDINLNVNTPSNSFTVNAKLKTPGSPINLALAFNQGKLTAITGSSGVGTDFTFLGAAVDIQTVNVINRNTTYSESWDPEFSLQGAIEIPKLKGFKGELTGTNKLVVNKDKAYLTGAHLSAADIQLGNWKLRNIQADFDGITNTFYGSAILQTYTGENIGVSLLFDSNGLKDITASNINFNLFGAKVSNATINFKPDRKPTEGDDWDPEFTFQGVIALPQALGGVTLSVTGSDYLLVNNDGFDLTGGKIYQETLDFNLLGFLRVQGKQISLLYSQIGTEKVFIIQGTLILPDLYNFTGNFSGSNYIKISSIGTVEVVGSISASDINIAAGWKIKTATVFIDTTNNQTKVRADATVIIPSGIDVAATVLWNGSQLQYVQIGAYNLNKPIGSTGAFLQDISGSYSVGPKTITVLGQQQTYNDVFQGNVKITVGPKVNLNLPSFLGGPINESLINLDLTATITPKFLNAQGNLRVLGNLVTGTGEVNLNWEYDSFGASANLNILYGLLKADAKLIARGHDGNKLDFYAYAEGTVNIPDPIPVIGGFTLGGGGAYFQYIDDGYSYNDYVAAWGKLLGWTVGLKIGFDGNVSLFGAELPELAKANINNLWANLNNPYTAPAALPLPPRGSTGNDIINGNDNPEFIDAVAGNDVLNGKGGDDILEGGDGNDILSGGAGKDVLNGGAGNDTLVGGTGDNTYIFDADTSQGSDTINETVIAIKSVKGNNITYAQATKTLWNIQQQDQKDGITDETKLTLINNGDGTISLKTYYDRFWSADSVGNITSSENINNWEKFRVENNGDGTISLKNIDWNTYVRANTISITDARWNIDQSNNKDLWEKFTIIDQNNSSTDTLDFSATTTKSINLDLSLAGRQQINDNLSLTLGITVGGQTFINIENAVGGSLNDTLIGNNFNNLLKGNAGDDYIDGGLGNDTLDGGANNDNISGSRGDDTIYGGSGDDYINAWEDNDYIDGGAGNDNINGLGGNDTLIGGAGNDTLNGDAGYDTAIFSGASVNYQISLLSNGDVQVIDTQANRDGTDILTDIEQINFNGGGTYQVFKGDALDNTLTAGGYWAVMYGGAGNDTLNGGSSNDILNGGAGIDILNGGAGDDTYVVDTTTDTITEKAGEGTDTIQSSVTFSLVNLPNIENLTLTGTAAINGIGNAANNVIIGNAANNTLNGGTGIDTADYSNAISGINVNLASGIANDGQGGTDILTSIEKVIGSSYNDTLTGSNYEDTLFGGDGNDNLIGGAGNDILNGGNGEDTADYSSATQGINVTLGGNGFATNDGFGNQDTLYGVDHIIGGQYNDTIVGDEYYNNTLNGGAGNDTINGLGGNDTVIGGAGNDTLNGGTGNDTAVFMGASVNYQISLLSNGDVQVTDTQTNRDGTDILTDIEQINFNGGGTYKVFKGDGSNNTLTADAYWALMYGGAGNDTLNGGGSDDILNGGDDNDNLIGNGGNDTLIGGAGNNDIAVFSGASVNYQISLLSNGDVQVTDTQTNRDGTDILTDIEQINFNGGGTYKVFKGDGSNNTLTADAYWALMYGGAGNDTLNGGGSDDTLNGGDGDDNLIGNGGNDTLIGGAGYDTAVFSGASVSYQISLLNNGDVQVTDTQTNRDGTDILTNIEQINFNGGGTYKVFKGDSSNNTLTADAYWALMYGGAGNDTLNGGGSDDTLNGGAGNDTLIGGAGYDTAVFSGASVSYQISLLNNGDVQVTDTQTNRDGTDILTNIEQINFNGGGTYKVFKGDSSNNTLTADAYWALMYGGAGNDTLNGGGSDDILNGGADNDTLIGNGAKDSLTGGSGADRFDYRNLADSVFNSFDVITDLNANSGNDLFLVSTARSGFSNVGSVATLDTIGIGAKLTNSNFIANAAAQFTFGNRTFVAINDGTSGFNSNTDAIVEVTGLTGTLGIGNFTTTLA
ncbi:bluetail domain-containing putative surface protein [Aulosira sp. FACHB-615]|uniref:bluetail domain-containing putative surface protein n=1 Tax=Aulosira sp. FACHB-615 TaxID=2692777 RepID=UPI0016844D97|nr:bluetail domain-containing putative surface protein [Aulosira sp. FACHB-615]MBD2491706.1 hypothetical protein [Aulosira sp. FACHB-615]